MLSSRGPLMRRFATLACLLVGAGLAGCGSSSTAPPDAAPAVRDAGPADAVPGRDAATDHRDAAPVQADALPEIPAYTPFDENVLLVKSGKPTVPVIPALRASNDARVTISSIVP